MTKKPMNTQVFFDEKVVMGKYCRVREDHWPVLTGRENFSRDDPAFATLRRGKREGGEDSGFAQKLRRTGSGGPASFVADFPCVGFAHCNETKNGPITNLESVDLLAN
jgi:hypothetical protein